MPVSISQSSLGRFTPSTPRSPAARSRCFNLAIEFGPVHAWLTCCPAETRICMFQSRNRVWAGSRRVCRPVTCSHFTCFNLAIEFGPVHAHRATHKCRRPKSFNLAIEFGPVHASNYHMRRNLGQSFNLAIEFGPVHAAMTELCFGGLLVFQSRNRVWAGSRDGQFQWEDLSRPVSISQSSLGRFTHEGCADGGAGDCSFNLAIEFGPVHACISA